MEWAFGRTEWDLTLVQLRRGTRQSSNRYRQSGPRGWACRYSGWDWTLDSGTDNLLNDRRREGCVEIVMIHGADQNSRQGIVCSEWDWMLLWPYQPETQTRTRDEKMVPRDKGLVDLSMKTRYVSMQKKFSRKRGILPRYDANRNLTQSIGYKWLMIQKPSVRIRYCFEEKNRLQEGGSCDKPKRTPGPKK